jgi:tetratricopeptide (TPR) repeat protein
MRRELGDRWELSECLTLKGRILYEQGDPAEARLCLQESLALARSLGERHSTAYALELLGEVASMENEVEARSLLTESLALYRELGDTLGIVSDEYLLGRLDLLYQRYAKASGHFQTYLRICQDWLVVPRIAQSLDGLAIVAAGLGRARRALRLAGASAHLRQDVPEQPSPRHLEELKNGLSPARKALGEIAAAAIWAEGQAMTLDEAVAYALQQDDANA